MRPEFFAWTRRSAELLRSSRLNEADLEHIAERVEGTAILRRRPDPGRRAYVEGNLLRSLGRGRLPKRQRSCIHRNEEADMTHRCANPECRFDYSGMRAVCAQPACLETPPPGCGRFYRLHADGALKPLPPSTAPEPGEAGAFWLCCYCAMQYDLVAPGQLRLAPDPYAFIWRWQIENAEASVAHEGA